MLLVERGAIEQRWVEHWEKFRMSIFSPFFHTQQKVTVEPTCTTLSIGYMPPRKPLSFPATERPEVKRGKICSSGSRPHVRWVAAHSNTSWDTNAYFYTRYKNSQRSAPSSNREAIKQEMVASQSSETTLVPFSTTATLGTTPPLALPPPLIVF